MPMSMVGRKPVQPNLAWRFCDVAPVCPVGRGRGVGYNSKGATRRLLERPLISAFFSRLSAPTTTACRYATVSSCRSSTIGRSLTRRDGLRFCLICLMLSWRGSTRDGAENVRR